jgi:hypothetical protein
MKIYDGMIGSEVSKIRSLDIARLLHTAIMDRGSVCVCVCVCANKMYLVALTEAPTRLNEITRS